VDLGLGLLERQHVEVEEVLVDVAHAAHLGGDGAEHPVVGVARVAVLGAEGLVAGVTRGQGQAVGILRVLGVGRHHVTRAAELPRLGGLEAGDVAAARGQEREHADPEEEQDLGGARQRRPPHQVPEQERHRERRPGQRHQRERIMGHR
jgi:hypothetical protein